MSLKDLANTAAAITLNGQQKDVAVGFADKVTDGTADALTLNLNGVGTAENAATTTVELKRVALTADGIEELNLGVAGTNVVTVDADAAKSVAATGAGALDVQFSAATTALKSVDASAVAGNVTVALDNLTSVATVKTGAGSDMIKATAADLAINATIDGGAGADRLELAVNGTTQYTMSGVETVALGGLGDALTFSAKNASGIETVEATKDLATAATFANLGSADLTFALKETSAGSITADNSGAATVTVTPSATAVKDKAAETNTTDLTLTNANSVNLTVAQYSKYTGDVTALKATSLEAKIDGEINNTIALAAATSAVLNATNKDAVGNAVVLEADKLVDLNITAAAAFSLDAASKLAALESLTVATAGAFAAGDLAAINSVNLSGTGTASLNDLGATDLGYGVSVVASTKELTINAIDVGAGQSINLDVANVAGAVTLTTDATVAQDAGGNETGSIIVNANGTQGDVYLDLLQAKSVTVNAAGALGGLDVDVIAETASLIGSELKANDIAVTASKSATVTGGIAIDAISVTADAAADGVATFTISGGLGVDTFAFDFSTGAGALRATIADLGTGGVEVLGGDFADVASTALTDAAALAAAQATLKAFLEDALGGTVTAENITNVLSLDATAAGTGSDFIFQYAGATHVVIDGGATADTAKAFGDNDAFVTLTGVASINTTTLADALFA